MSQRPADSQHDLAAAYALDALSPDERRDFEAFLATSPEAQRDVAEFREVAALLALASPENVAPRTDLRDRVIAARRGETVVPIESRRRLVPTLLGGALAASLAAAVWLGARERTLRSELAQRDSTAIALERQLASATATLTTLMEPGTELVQLTATGDPEPGIQLFWNRKRNTVLLHAYRFQQAPAGRTYQLWFIRDGKPVPSVTFNAEPTGQAVVTEVPVPTDGSVTAAAITEEPAGGSAQPTSPVLMSGALTKS